MESTEVEVHTQYKTERTSACAQNKVAAFCSRLTGIPRLGVVFVNECLGVLRSILGSEGNCCGMLTHLSTVW